MIYIYVCDDWHTCFFFHSTEAVPCRNESTKFYNEKNQTIYYKEL